MRCLVLLSCRFYSTEESYDYSCLYSFITLPEKIRVHSCRNAVSASSFTWPENYSTLYQKIIVYLCRNVVSASSMAGIHIYGGY